MAYEFNGNRYRDASAHQKQWGRRIVSQLPLRGNERILDLGCGDGALTAELADRVPDGSVLGIDASEGMIEVANKHTAANLTFELLNINELESLAAGFDLIFSNATLHWIKDHASLWENVYRLLNDKGGARFNFAGQGNCSSFFEVVRQAMSLDQFKSYFSGFDWPWYMPSVDEYENLMGASAFLDYRVWPENADHFFADVDAMAAWVEQPSLVPFVEHVAESDRPAFRDFVVGRMIRRTRQSDGRCFETFRRINVSACK